MRLSNNIFHPFVLIWETALLWNINPPPCSLSPPKGQLSNETLSKTRNFPENRFVQSFWVLFPWRDSAIKPCQSRFWASLHYANNDEIGIYFETQSYTRLAGISTTKFSIEQTTTSRRVTKWNFILPTNRSNRDLFKRSYAAFCLAHSLFKYPIKCLFNMIDDYAMPTGHCLDKHVSQRISSAFSYTSRLGFPYFQYPHSALLLFNSKFQCWISLTKQ